MEESVKQGAFENACIRGEIISMLPPCQVTSMDRSQGTAYLHLNLQGGPEPGCAF